MSDEVEDLEVVTSPRKSQLWIWICVAVFVLVLYVLAIGPAIYISAKIPILESLLKTVYKPLGAVLVWSGGVEDYGYYYEYIMWWAELARNS